MNTTEAKTLRQFSKATFEAVSMEELDLLDTCARKEMFIESELEKIADARKRLAIEEGWREVTDDEVSSRLRNGTRIRCFATSCGCAGQLEIIERPPAPKEKNSWGSKKDVEILHTKHSQPVAYGEYDYDYDKYNWYLVQGVVLFVKDRKRKKKNECPACGHIICNRCLGCACEKAQGHCEEREGIPCMNKEEERDE